MITLLLDAALMTLGLAIVSLVGGLLLALLLSAAELSRHVWLRWPVATLTTVIRGAANLSHIRQYETVLGASRSAPNWLISSVLYISLNFLSGSTYFTALGMTARSRNGCPMPITDAATIVSVSTTSAARWGAKRWATRENSTGDSVNWARSAGSIFAGPCGGPVMPTASGSLTRASGAAPRPARRGCARGARRR